MADGSRKRRQDDESLGLTKKDLAHCIRECITSSFGIAASGMAQDVQGMQISLCWSISCKAFGGLTISHARGSLSRAVRLYDESSRLAMIRVSRDSCGLVRAAITLLTSFQGRSVVASVISVNGSARTAKRAAVLETRREAQQEGATGKQELRDLEERLDMIRKID